MSPEGGHRGGSSGALADVGASIPFDRCMVVRNPWIRRFPALALAGSSARTCDIGIRRLRNDCTHSESLIMLREGGLNVYPHDAKWGRGDASGAHTKLRMPDTNPAWTVSHPSNGERLPDSRLFSFRWPTMPLSFLPTCSCRRRQPHERTAIV